MYEPTAVEYVLYNMRLRLYQPGQRMTSIQDVDTLFDSLTYLIGTMEECDVRITCAEELQMLADGNGTPGEEYRARAKLEHESSYVAVEVERAVGVIGMLQKPVQ